MVKTAISPTPAVKSNTIKALKSGFTLLELVIVVLIMGLVYGMVSLSITQATTTLPVLSASNISGFLATQKDSQTRTFYLYGDTCQYIRFDPELPKGTSINQISFDKRTTAFWFDNFGNMQRQNYAPLRADHFDTTVCLKFAQFTNGSFTPLVIQSGGKFYYHSFFEGVQTFSTLEEAAQWIKHTHNNPKDLGLLQ